MKNSCDANHFLTKLHTCNLTKNIVYSYFSKVLTRCFRIAFCSTPTFAEHHPTITSTTKYETPIHNSVKCYSSYKKMTQCFSSQWKNVMRCAIWYHLYNFKNVKNTHGGVLILVKLQVLACNATHQKYNLYVILPPKPFLTRRLNKP